jgi:amidophosphoribosyltransferase
MPAEYAPRVETEDTPREECGVFAVIRLDGENDESMADKAYRGLSGLQHRGEDGAGITIYNRRTRNKFYTMKNKGLITSVFAGGSHLSGFPEGSLALAHTRYGTGGKSGDAAEKAHPHGSKRYAFMIAVNGHMKELEGADDDGKTDTEHLVDVIDARMTETGEDFKAALLAVLGTLTGGYSLIASDGNRVIAARDPWGIRPLVQASNGEYHYFSSEDSALRIPSLGIHPGQATEVPPGKLITITPGQEIEYDDIYHDPIPLGKTAMCAMEWAYFARPDSNMGGRNAQEVRFNIGRLLAEQEKPDFSADIVIGVPDSGSDSATAYAEQLGIPYVRAIHKNAYVGRTFIQETPDARIDAAWLKFRINAELVKDKRVVIVDDSIVRGTNIGVIVKMAYEAGATEVHVRAGFPKHKWPCIYGIDTGDPTQLIANKMTERQMCAHLDIASIGFITGKNLRKAISPKIGGVCMACVDGKYPTAADGHDRPLLPLIVV